MDLLLRLYLLAGLVAHKALWEWMKRRRTATGRRPGADDASTAAATPAPGAASPAASAGPTAEGEGAGPGSAPPRAVSPLRARLARLAKRAILAGLVAQTVAPAAWTAPLALPDGPVPWRAIGAALFTFGLGVAMLGRWQLGDNWADIEAARKLAGQRVVDRGLYRWIRHPIYVGDLLLLVGFELALESWLVVGALLLVPVVLRQAVSEERMLVATLAGYADYCRRSKRFVPFLI